MDIMAYKGKKPYVFVSYAHSDEEKVKLLLERLHKNGVRFWYDQGIRSENWRSKIADEIVSCRVMLVFLSKSYGESRDCKREVILADDNLKEFCVVRLDNAKLDGALAYILSGEQYKTFIDISAEEMLGQIRGEPWFTDCTENTQLANEWNTPVLEPIRSHKPYNMYWDGRYTNNPNRNISAIWGPERLLYCNGEKPNVATFNSEFSRIYGDERYFITIKKHEERLYSSEMVLEPSQIYDVRILYHNNANEDSNKTGYGVATGVRAGVQLPSVIFPGRCSLLRAGLRAKVFEQLAGSQDGVARPINVWAAVKLYTQDTPIFLEYIQASAKIENRGATNGKVVSSYLFSEEGMFLGFNKLTGVLPGGEKYAGYIHFQIATYYPDPKFYFSVVRSAYDGVEWVNDKISAKPGSCITFLTTIRYNGLSGTGPKEIYVDDIMQDIQYFEEYDQNALPRDNVTIFDNEHTDGMHIDFEVINSTGYLFSLHAGSMISVITQAFIKEDYIGCINTKSIVRFNKCEHHSEVLVDVRGQN